MTARSFIAVYLLMQGIASLVLPRAVIAFNGRIARLLRRRPLPERETHVRVFGMIETAIGALLLAPALS